MSYHTEYMVYHMIYRYINFRVTELTSKTKHPDEVHRQATKMLQTDMLLSEHQHCESEFS